VEVEMEVHIIQKLRSASTVLMGWLGNTFPFWEWTSSEGTAFSLSTLADILQLRCLM